jgi:hypothetical protein
MANAETLEFVSTTDEGEPEYQARHVGRAKYAVVLCGERDEVVGWGYDEEGAIKIARALNEAEAGKSQ